MKTLQQVEEMMQEAVSHLKEDLKGLRTGHANPAMLEKVTVEVYGSMMPLRDLCSISSPEPRQLLVSPYDPGTVDPIRKGIEKANLGFSLIVDGHAIRVKIPPMDESLRKEMIKILHDKSEKAKVGVRNIRRDGNETARKLKSDGEIGEDELKVREKKIQECTDKYCKEIDTYCGKKETEILTI